MVAMVRLWLSREHTISIREQLSAQLLLGIVSQRLPAGERLPSVRELARRLGIHANTVSAAYRDLAARGWVSKRRGSGVYVRDVARAQAKQDIEGFVRAHVEEGASRGFTAEALQLAFTKIANEGRAKKLMVVHSDEALARIVAREVEDAIGSPVSFGTFEQARRLPIQDCCLLVLPAQAAQAAQEFGAAPYRTIGLKSMDEMLAGRRRPPATALIGVVSRSESILGWATTLLSALGFSPAAVLRCNPDKRGWRRGLSSCTIVASDVEAVHELSEGIEPAVLRIVSDEFLDQMRELVDPGNGFSMRVTKTQVLAASEVACHDRTLDSGRRKRLAKAPVPPTLKPSANAQSPEG
jgi:DNA-binding transcriptional regulator YhcF (GntR family)